LRSKKSSGESDVLSLCNLNLSLYLLTANGVFGWFMSKFKYSSEYISSLLHEFKGKSGTSTAFFKARGINGQTFYGWREKFGYMTAQQIDSLRGLEQENHRLQLENEKLLSQSNAATEFLMDEFPDAKTRRTHAKKLVDLGRIGQTDVCELFSIKLNSFHYSHNKRNK